MSDLPSGWDLVQLRDLLARTIGGVWGGEPGTDDSDVDVIRVTEMSADGRIDPSTAARRSISIAQLASRSLIPDDLLLEKSGGGPRRPVGRVGRVTSAERTSVCANFMQLMRVDREVAAPRYVEHYLRYFHAKGGTEPLQTATTNIRNLRTKDYLRVLVPLPPLLEQDRVVTSIEEHLSRIDAAEALLSAGSHRLRSLVREVWPAPAGRQWPHVPLSQLLLAQRGKNLRQGWSPRCERRPSPDEHTWGVLKTSAVQFGRFIQSENKALPASLKSRPDLEISDGDFLVTSGGPRARIGVACIVKSPRPLLMASDKMFIFRPDSKRIIPMFLLRYLMSPPGLQELERLKTGSNDSGLRISQSAFKGLPVPVPPLEVQRELVEHMSAVYDRAEALASHLSIATTRSTLLRQSILAAAFCGRLVPQDPHDEPAGVLPKRVRTDPVSAGPTMRSRQVKA